MFIFLLSGPFCCLGFSGVIFFAVWAGACSFFCCLGGGPSPAQTGKKMTRPHPNSKKKRTRPLRACFFVCCLVRWGCSFFCCLGGGRGFFFYCLGGGREFTTYRSAWLVFKRPNNKKDQTAKKTHGFLLGFKDSGKQQKCITKWRMTNNDPLGNP